MLRRGSVRRRGGAQGIDDAIFPQRFEVDFVRVFKPRR